VRHRIGIVLGAAMAAELFFAGGWGYLRLLRPPAPGDQLTQLPAGGGALTSDGKVLIALAAVAGTGLLAGILIAAPRISPLATGLPGLLLLGWTGLYLVSVRQAVDLIPLRSDPFGAGFEAMLFNGSLAAAGLAMIIPMFVPSRWRRAADDMADIADIVGTAGTAGSVATAATVATTAATGTAGTVPAVTELRPVARWEPGIPAETASIAPAGESPWAISARAAAAASDRVDGRGVASLGD
jgi:hypothetical protein